MTSVDDKAMTLARVDMVELLARVVRETAETAREVHENYEAYINGAWKCVSYPMKPTLFQKCRSKKDESDGGGGNKIGATLVARMKRMENLAKILADAWMVKCQRRCVEGLKSYKVMGLMS